MFENRKPPRGRSRVHFTDFFEIRAQNSNRFTTSIGQKHTCTSRTEKHEGMSVPFWILFIRRPCGQYGLRFFIIIFLLLYFSRPYVSPFWSSSSVAVPQRCIRKKPTRRQNPHVVRKKKKKTRYCRGHGAGLYSFKVFAVTAGIHLNVAFFFFTAAHTSSAIVGARERFWKLEKKIKNK